MTEPAVSYQREQTLDLTEAIDLYRASTLGERRPVDDRERMGRMLANANLIVTARLEGRLVGIARSVTDWSYCTYLSDLAVDLVVQRKGIGRELIRQTREAAPQASLILLAAPKAVDYYPKLGFTRHDSAWVLRPGDELR